MYISFIGLRFEQRQVSLGETDSYLNASLSVRMIIAKIEDSLSNGAVRLRSSTSEVLTGKRSKRYSYFNTVNIIQCEI